jgi:hypothetical protein
MVIRWNLGLKWRLLLKIYRWHSLIVSVEDLYLDSFNLKSCLQSEPLADYMVSTFKYCSFFRSGPKAIDLPPSLSCAGRTICSCPLKLWPVKPGPALHCRSLHLAWYSSSLSQSAIGNVLYMYEIQRDLPNKSNSLQFWSLLCMGWCTWTLPGSCFHRELSLAENIRVQQRHIWCNTLRAWQGDDVMMNCMVCTRSWCQEMLLLMNLSADCSVQVRCMLRQ